VGAEGRVSVRTWTSTTPPCGRAGVTHCTWFGDCATAGTIADPNMQMIAPPVPSPWPGNIGCWGSGCEGWGLRNYARRLMVQSSSSELAEANHRLAANRSRLNGQTTCRRKEGVGSEHLKRRRGRLHPPFLQLATLTRAPRMSGSQKGPWRPFRTPNWTLRGRCWSASGGWGRRSGSRMGR
jgi:hypothetical protein